MRGCLDEGLLQSYFDGELSGKQLESATLHLTACPSCAAAARQLEGEIGLVASALAPELEAMVPTERLRQRIDTAIAGLPQVDHASKLKTGSLRWLRSLSSFFALTPQQAFGYVALAVVVTFAVVFGIVQKQQPVSQGLTAQKAPPAIVPVIPTVDGGENAGTQIMQAPIAVDDDNGEASPPVVHSPGPRRPRDHRAVAQVKLIPGERSYLKTIAALDSTIKANNDRPMKPALRAEYERNLAVVNRALAATRTAAKNNPNDPDAKEFLFDAYQSKVDLLNTVADARSFNRQQ